MNAMVWGCLLPLDQARSRSQEGAGGKKLGRANELLKPDEITAKISQICQTSCSSTPFCQRYASSGAMVSGASTTLGAGRAAGELKTELPARRGVASEKLRTREDEE